MFSVRGKVHRITRHEGTDGQYKFSPTFSLTSVLDERGGVTPRPGRLTPKNDPIPII